MTTPRELVDLLRTVDKLHIDASNPVPTYVFVAIEEAALTIERLVEALEPFAKHNASDEYINNPETPDHGVCAAAAFQVGLFRRARRALSGGE